MSGSHNDHHNSEYDYNIHHILSGPTSRNVFLFLLGMTIITVLAAKIDLGASWNFALAMAIASAKALIVTLFFMGLKFDSKENRVFFYSSFIFVTIFIVQTAADIFTRPAGYKVVGDPLKTVAAAGGPEFKRPWEPSPEMNAVAKNLYDVNCAVCHGVEGKGNGPGSNLPVKPRNYTVADGWKNGRRPSDVFLTLQNGLAPYMPAYPQLSANERWALAHYVLAMGPAPTPDNADSLKRVGVLDPNRDDGGVVKAAVQRKIPRDFAIERYIQSGQ